MYKLNGFSLDSPSLGWTVLDASEWTAGTTMSRPSLQAPGYDGSVPLPGYRDTPALGIVIGTQHSRLAALKTLLEQPVLTLERAGTEGDAIVQLEGISEERVTSGKDPYMEVKAVLSIPGVWFRGPVTETAGTTVSRKTVVDVFPGLTGKVTDSLIRFTDITNPKVTDSAGTFMAYKGVVNPGQFLILDSATGLGRMTTSQKWDQGTEVDPLLLSYGRGPAFFTITPFIDKDPAETVGRLTVTATTATETSKVTVRGRSAYSV